MGTLRFLCDRSSSAYRAFPTTEQPHVLRRLVFHRCTTITFIHYTRTVVKCFPPTLNREPVHRSQYSRHAEQLRRHACGMRGGFLALPRGRFSDTLRTMEVHF